MTLSELRIDFKRFHWHRSSYMMTRPDKNRLGNLYREEFSRYRNHVLQAKAYRVVKLVSAIDHEVAGVKELKGEIFDIARLTGLASLL